MYKDIFQTNGVDSDSEGKQIPQSSLGGSLVSSLDSHDNMNSSLWSVELKRLEVKALGDNNV